MPMKPPSREALQARLARHQQEHLLDFWNELDDPARVQLAGQIESVDFDLLGRLIRGNHDAPDWEAVSARAEPPQAIRLASPDAAAVSKRATALGEAEIRAGRVGALLVAGGQGTRLDYHRPKGMYPLGPLSGASLFQILLEKLSAARRRYGVAIPLLVMTSPATDAETRDYFSRTARFGLPEEDVFIFCQGTMPAVELATGRVLLSAKDSLALSPDGHGGTVAALSKSGLLDELESRGIERLFYFQVDNPLVRLCDPEFIGHHVEAGSRMSTQAVARRFATEKVGNVVRVEGVTRIIEYSDLSKEAAEKQAADGSLQLWAGNIAVHVLDVAFAREAAESPELLPFHVARKAVPTIDRQGNAVEPRGSGHPNALKFERFIFDLLPSAGRSIVQEVEGWTTFAPVKNAPGSKTDTPEQARAQLVSLHTSWLMQAGVVVDPGAVVEIRSTYALDAEDVSKRVQPGTRVERARLFE